MIRWFIGPYRVTKETGPDIAKIVRFRHYKPEELEVARRFIAKALLPGDYKFDVYLLTERAKEIMKRLLPKQKALAIPWMARIDMVCEDPYYTWIIEVKQELRRSGIGELMNYRDLYVQQYRPIRPVRLAYVAKIDDLDVHRSCVRRRIKVFLV